MIYFCLFIFFCCCFLIFTVEDCFFGLPHRAVPRKHSNLSACIPLFLLSFSYSLVELMIMMMGMCVCVLCTWISLFLENSILPFECIIIWRWCKGHKFDLKQKKRERKEKLHTLKRKYEQIWTWPVQEGTSFATCGCWLWPAMAAGVCAVHQIRTYEIVWFVSAAINFPMQRKSDMILLLKRFQLILINCA